MFAQPGTKSTSFLCKNEHQNRKGKKENKKKAEHIWPPAIVEKR